MHEGLRVDPATGWDEGPPLGRVPRAMRWLLSWSDWAWPLLFVRGGAFWYLTGLCVFGGAQVLLLGLEARALAACRDADTRASRQLRWERALLYGSLSVLVSLTSLLMGLEGVSSFALPRWTALAFLAAAAAGLSQSALGLRWAFRHRPGALGRAPSESASA